MDARDTRSAAPGDRTILAVLARHVGDTRASGILARARRELPGQRGPLPARQHLGRLGDALRTILGEADTRRAAPDFTLPDEPEREEKVILTLLAQHTTVAPGSTTLLALTFDHAPHWHIHTNAPVVPAAWKAASFEPFPTIVTMEPADGLKLRGIKWPRPVEILVISQALAKLRSTASLKARPPSSW